MIIILIKIQKNQSYTETDAYKKKNKHTNGKFDKMTNGQVGKLTNGQTNEQTD